MIKKADRSWFKPIEEFNTDDIWIASYMLDMHYVPIATKLYNKNAFTLGSDWS